MLVLNISSSKHKNQKKGKIHEKRLIMAPDPGRDRLGGVSIR